MTKTTRAAAKRKMRNMFCSSMEPADDELAVYILVERNYCRCAVSSSFNSTMVLILKTGGRIAPYLLSWRPPMALQYHV